MLYMQRGIQRHNVGGVGHFSIDNGQEKTLLTPISYMHMTLLSVRASGMIP
jgi:hypothetical protein